MTTTYLHCGLVQDDVRAVGWSVDNRADRARSSVPELLRSEEHRAIWQRACIAHGRDSSDGQPHLFDGTPDVRSGDECSRGMHVHADIHEHPLDHSEMRVQRYEQRVDIQRCWRNGIACGGHHARLLLVREQHGELGIGVQSKWSRRRVDPVHRVGEHGPTTTRRDAQRSRTGISADPGTGPVQVFPQQQRRFDWICRRHTERHPSDTHGMWVVGVE